MMEHHLKCWAPHYESMRAGNKPFDIRKNDRGYQRGDILVQHAHDMRARKDLDPEICPPLYFRVTYVLSGHMYGLREDYVCMGLAPITEEEASLERLGSALRRCS